MSAKRDIDRTVKRIENILRRPINKSDLTQIGRLAISFIRQRTRAGFGVKSAANVSARRRSKLKSLSSGYVKFRKSSPKLNRGLTSPGKSNLTFTGQLLNSLRVIDTDERSGSVFINANRRRRKGGVTNEDVARFVSEQGREFLNLTRGEALKIANAYENKLVSVLKRQFE